MNDQNILTAEGPGWIRALCVSSQTWTPWLDNQYLYHNRNKETNKINALPISGVVVVVKRNVQNSLLLVQKGINTS